MSVYIGTNGYGLVVFGRTRIFLVGKIKDIYFDFVIEIGLFFVRGIGLAI